MLFKRKPTAEELLLEKTIADTIRQLDSYPAASKEATDIMVMVERLCALRYTNAKPRVSPDTAVMAVAHVGGILAIVLHERAHVVTTKSMSLVGKFMR